ncbi:MAG: 30S ribosomal protein S2 [Nitrospirae bacterium]|nr:30S ribosomal protein S2 [Nitrospirota bacterium]
MAELTVTELIEAGVHLGHPTQKWNPKMAPYIYGAKRGIHILNVNKTIDLCKEACNFVGHIVARGEKVLLIGTKPQAQMIVGEIAKAHDMPYVNLRWVGGTLTNFNTIKKCVEQIKALERMEKEGFSPAFTKKEVRRMILKRDKMQSALEGILNMDKLPGALVVVDSEKEHIAIQEAHRLSIPVVALADTNSDPDEMAYPIPANDDSVRSIRLFLTRIGEAISDGRLALEKSMHEQRQTAEPEVQVAQTTIAGVKVERGKVRMRRTIEELIAAYDEKQEPRKS